MLDHTRSENSNNTKTNNDPASTPITVCGAGAWGTALAIAIARCEKQVRLWSNCAEDIAHMRKQRTNPSYLGDILLAGHIELYDNLEEATSNATDLLIVVPSGAFAEVLSRLKKLEHQKTFRLAWGTKGIDPAEHKLLHQLCEEQFPASPLAMISGPSFAKEVAMGSPTRLTIASKNPAFAQRLQQALASPTLGIEISDDIIGVEIAATAKNVFAILVGIADGLGWKDNSRAALLTLICQELQRLILCFDGQKQSLLSAAGIGDLILTCCNNQSRNRQFGLAIGEGRSIAEAEKKVGKLVEGYHNCKQLQHLASPAKEFPVLQAAFNILYQQADCQKTLLQLLTS